MRVMRNRNRRACSRPWIGQALLPLLVLGGACGTARTGSPSAGSASTGSARTGSVGVEPAGSRSARSASRDALAGDITAMVAGVEPAQRAELHALASELAADWQREAGRDKDTEAILALLR